MKPILITILVWCSLSSCGHGNVEHVEAKIAKMSMLPPPPGTSDIAEADKIEAADIVEKPDASAASENNPVIDTSKKIIKEGDISFETADLANSRKAITDTLKTLGGYVSEEKATNDNGDGRKQVELTARVPAKNFEAFLSSISATAARIDRKSIAMVDATARFIDMNTQLRNKRLLETSYLDLLKRANKMTDLLAIESKLSEIRTAIDSTQGQLNYLSKRVAYSTLDITFYTKKAPVENTTYGFAYKFKEALGNGWQWLEELFYGLVSAWPGIIAFCICIWLFRRWRKRRRVAERLT